MPQAWQVTAVGQGEAVFLSALDNVLDRSQLGPIFDFAYVWGIYRRPAEVRYGRCVTPILLGDRLIGRMSPRFDQATRRLMLEGIWLEDPAEAALPALHEGMARGLRRLQVFLGAEEIDMAHVRPVKLRAAVAAALRRL